VKRKSSRKSWIEGAGGEEKESGYRRKRRARERERGIEIGQILEEEGGREGGREGEEKTF